MKKLVISIMCLFLAACATNKNVQRLSSSHAGISSKTSFAHSERRKWQAKAKANDANAQYHLGNSYCCGDSGYFDTEKAIEWWCKASRQGDMRARKALALHDHGKSCPFGK